MDIDLAWKVIDHWIENDYGDDKEDATEEMGNLDDLALRVSEAIERFSLLESDGIPHIASRLDMELF